MKRFLVFLISLFFGLGVFFWIIKSIGWVEIKNAFFAFSGLKGIVILILTGLMLVISAWKWKVVLKSQGYNISLKELSGLHFVAFSVFFFVPVLFFGGEIFRAYFLKERKSVPREKAMASVIIDRVSQWTCNLAIILAGIIFFVIKIAPLPSRLELILFIFLAMLIIGAAFFYYKSFRKESIVKLFIRSKKNHFLGIEKEVFKFFKPKRIIMWKVLAIALLRSASDILRCWLVILFLGKWLSFFPVLTIASFYFLSRLVPIPASLGSHDALQSLAFSSMGLGANTGTVFAIVIRGAELIVALIGAVILLKLGLGLLRSILVKKIDIFTEFFQNSKK